jgi:hypothetical protein
LKVWFSSWIDTLLRYYCMHSMSNLNKSQNSYQVLKFWDFVSRGNKGSKTHKEYLNIFLGHKILTTNTLGTNVHKIYECDKNQVPYCNVKKFKKWNFWEFWAIDRTWPTLDKFYYILTFIIEHRYFRSLYKIWNKIISFDMEKRGNLK